jgi:60 kDa SS-A/Ro ribonucleoprotein
MVALNQDPDSYCYGFSTTFVDLKLSANMRLNDVQRRISGLPFSRTDCSLPMEWAIQNNVELDSFEVYTDNETYAGRRHPVQALKAYRDKTGINAKLVVNGMVANPFTIADPSDGNSLDVVGFDASAPQVISSFINS